jgi:hypothetical protein
MANRFKQMKQKNFPILEGLESRTFLSGSAPAIELAPGAGLREEHSSFRLGGHGSMFVSQNVTPDVVEAPALLGPAGAPIVFAGPPLRGPFVPQFETTIDVDGYAAGSGDGSIYLSNFQRGGFSMISLNFFGPPPLTSGVSVSGGATGEDGTASEPSKGGAAFKATASASLGAGVQNESAAIAARPAQSVLASSSAPAKQVAAERQNTGEPVEHFKPLVTGGEKFAGLAESPNFVFTLVAVDLESDFAWKEMSASRSAALPAVAGTAEVTERFVVAEASALAHIANTAAARIAGETKLIWWETAGLLGSVVFLAAYGANMRSPHKGTGEEI